MPVNRNNKFKRLFPKAVEFDAHLRELSDKFKKSLTKEEKEYMKYVGKLDELTKLDPKQVKDKELVRIIELVHNDDHKKTASLAQSLGMDFPDENPFTAYPLIEAATYYYGWRRNNEFADHAMMYINAVYSAQNGNGKKGK
jgi:hypothetical protein